MKIKIVDSPMGTGKTKTMKQIINASKEYDKFMFITPYLDEIHGSKDSKGKLVKTGIVQDCPIKNFREPKNTGKGKLNSLKSLVLNGDNISTTHALMSLFDEATIKTIEMREYTLILDEVADVVSDCKLKLHDFKIALNNGLVTIGENNRVMWNSNATIDDEVYSGDFYKELKALAYSESLYYVSDKLIMWCFPAKFFKCFKEVYILTYMFDSQIQKYYYDLFDIDYEYYQVERNEGGINTLVPKLDNSQDLTLRKKAQELITILQNEKMNRIGDKPTDLSKNWYIRNLKIVKSESFVELKSNLLNFYMNQVEGGSDVSMWTTFKDFKNTLKGNGYTKGFVSCNARATNAYDKCSNCAYCINLYLRPPIKTFFANWDIIIDEDSYALSEMLQWLFRSAIRKGEPINLYVPSSRMRKLLEDWLDCK